jgi:hypothetical protein
MMKSKNLPKANHEQPERVSASKLSNCSTQGEIKQCSIVYGKNGGLDYNWVNKKVAEQSTKDGRIPCSIVYDKNGGVDYNWFMNEVYPMLRIELDEYTEGLEPDPDRKVYQVGKNYYRIENHKGKAGITSIRVMAHLEDDLYFVDYFDGYNFGFQGMHLGNMNIFEFSTNQLAEKTLDQLQAKCSDNGDPK